MPERFKPTIIPKNDVLKLESNRPDLKLEVNNEGERNLEDFMSADSDATSQETQNLKKILNDNVDNVKVRKPKYGVKATSSEQIEKFNQRYDKIPQLVERIKIIEKCLPYPNGEVFINKINQIKDEIEDLLKNESGLISIGDNADTQDSFEQLVSKSGVQLAFIEQEFLNDAESKLNEFFRPLINTARSDVRRFLIKHFNTVDMSFTEAQKIIAEKWQIERPIVFKFRANLFNVGDKTDRPGVLGQTDGRLVEVFMDDITFLNDSKLDEGELLDTVIHEIIHNVSDITKKGVGLEQEMIQAIQDQNDAESSTVKTNLNELMTQIITMEIASKYYRTEKTNPIIFKKTEQQQITGYQSLVEPFLDLKTKYPNEINELIKIATDTMMRGNFDNLNSFLANHEAITKELKKIVK